VAGIAHRSFSGPPETFSPPFSPLCPWIRGLFPTIEFAVAPSTSLPNSGDPGATLARARLNAVDLTAAERSGAARSRLFPRSDPLRPIQIERPGPRDTASARAPDTPWPTCQCHLQPLGPPSDPLGLVRTPRTPPRPILIERLGPPRAPAAAYQRPSPLALDLLGQCALPLCR
jgi:hypothetical protein